MVQNESCTHSAVTDVWAQLHISHGLETLTNLSDVNKRPNIISTNPKSVAFEPVVRLLADLEFMVLYII